MTRKPKRVMARAYLGHERVKLGGGVAPYPTKLCWWARESPNWSLVSGPAVAWKTCASASWVTVPPAPKVTATATPVTLALQSDPILDTCVPPAGREMRTSTYRWSEVGLLPLGSAVSAGMRRSRGSQMGSL